MYTYFGGKKKKNSIIYFIILYIKDQIFKPLQFYTKFTHFSHFPFTNLNYK